MKSKLTALESIRGIAAFSVLLGHFAVAFYPAAVLGPSLAGHLSIESLLFKTPLSIVIAADFAVTLFFVLSGFVLTLSVFQKKKDVVGQVIKRYFRLMPVALGAVMLAYFLVELGLMYNSQAANISGSGWLGQFWNFNINFLQALFQGLVGIFVIESNGVQSLDPVLWTLYYELLGSILIYGFANLIKNDKRRWLVYIIAIVCFLNTRFIGFIIGALIADLYVNKKELFERFSKLGWYYKLLFLLVGVYFASVPAYAPPESLSSIFQAIIIFPNYFMLSKNILYVIAGAIFIIGALTIGRFEKVLSIKPLVWLGGLSYSLYAVHLLVLGSIISYAFVRLNTIYSYNIASLISLFLLITISLLVAVIFRVFIDVPSIKASSQIAAKISKK